MKMRDSRMGLGSLAAIAVGGALLYANRFRVQRMLESVGIKTPWLTGSVTDAINSGAAKLGGQVDNAIRSPETHA